MLITLWVWTLANVYMARFVSAKWRQMRVIDVQEPALTEALGLAQAE